MVIDQTVEIAEILGQENTERDWMLRLEEIKKAIGGLKRIWIVGEHISHKKLVARCAG